MAQQYNNDFKNAMTIFTQRQADDQKAQMERWRILQETQTRIFEIQQDVMTNKLQIQSEAYKRWDEYIRA
jgi:hypothetical protein